MKWELSDKTEHNIISKGSVDNSIVSVREIYNCIFK